MGFFTNLVIICKKNIELLPTTDISGVNEYVIPHWIWREKLLSFIDTLKKKSCKIQELIIKTQILEVSLIFDTIGSSSWYHFLIIIDYFVNSKFYPQNEITKSSSAKKIEWYNENPFYTNTLWKTKKNFH